jgi:hypothetical protein
MNYIAHLCASVVLVLGAVSAMGEQATSAPGRLTSAPDQSRLPVASATAEPPGAELAGQRASDAQLISSLNAQIAVLNAQTAEMKRSEDRLLQVVLWALGLTGLLNLGGYWANAKLQERERKQIRAEVLDDLKPEVATTVHASHAKLLAELRTTDEATRVFVLGRMFEAWFYPQNFEQNDRAFTAALDAAVMAAKQGGAAFDEALQNLKTVVDASQNKRIDRRLVDRARDFAEDTLTAIDRESSRGLIDAIRNIHRV